MRIFATALLLIATAAQAATAPHPALRSPWDLHPPQPAGRAYACPAPVALPRNIVLSDYYSDPQHSIPDPARLHAYQQASAPFHRVMQNAEAAADAYRATGSTAAAACTLRILQHAARERAMTGRMSSNQAYYVQNWTIGALAVTYLKVRTSPAGTQKERNTVTKWLEDVARSTQAHFQAQHEKKAGDGMNNHLYWAGFAVMAAGIAANNRDFYNWAEGTYFDGLRSITLEGALPLEMARGRRALHYHLFAAAPLVMMASFAEANGQDLYAADRNALHRLVDRCVSGLYSSAWFAQQAHAPQDTPGKTLTAEDVAWLRPYLHRFPDPGPAALLRQLPSMSYQYLGGIPPK